MIDWTQLAYYLLTACGALLCAITVYYVRRIDSHENQLATIVAGQAVINALLQKHDVRLDAIDLSIVHIREFAHDTRGLLPSPFEKQEIDRRRSETAKNFERLFGMLDEMREQRYKFQQEVMALLATKQDKP